MKINTELLEQFRQNRAARNIARDLEHELTIYKNESKRLWGLVRLIYDIPVDILLKVELDCPVLAGELRFKDSGLVYNPHTAVVDCPNTAVPNSAIDTSRIVLIDGNNVAHICTSLEDLISRMDDTGLINFATYRVAAR